MKASSKKQYGIFSFFTGAGFLDSGFEDARKEWLRKEIGPLDSRTAQDLEAQNGV